MRSTWSRLLLVLVLALFAAGRAEAYRFGSDDSIHKIQDVTLKGAKDEKLFLGHLTKTHWFLGGLYVEDAGYVLGVDGDSKRYYHMPQGDELAGFQRNGFLPNPLPPYSLSAIDYILGYSLWWGLAIVALFWWLGDRKKRAAASAEQAMPATPATPQTPGTPGTPPAP